MGVFILFIRLQHTPSIAGSALTIAKKRDKKEKKVRRAKIRNEIEAQRAKPRTPTQVIDELIGDEEQTGERKPKRRKRKKQGMASNPATTRAIDALIGDEEQN